MRQSDIQTAQQSLARELAGRGLLPADAAWTALAGGRTNLAWLVEHAGRREVVKLFVARAASPLFPNDPAQEAAALRYLQGRGLAPCLRHSLQARAGACLIYAYVDGRPWQSGVAEAARLLHRVHAIAAPPELRDAPNGSAALARQTRAILRACRPDTARRIAAKEPRGHVPPSRRRCLLHGDPVPGNMIGRAGRLRLIDWQCPAAGDPCEDLALFLSPAMQIAYRGRALSGPERAGFLAAYPDGAARARFEKLAPWYHWRMLAFCRWRTERGDPVSADCADAESAELHAAT